jgi:hypothetical protein
VENSHDGSCSKCVAGRRGLGGGDERRVASLSKFPM